MAEENKTQPTAPVMPSGDTRQGRQALTGSPESQEKELSGVTDETNGTKDLGQLSDNEQKAAEAKNAQRGSNNAASHGDNTAHGAAAGGDKPEGNKSKSQQKREDSLRSAKKNDSADEDKTEDANGDMVEIRSADGRTLEASIGDSNWSGKVIHVPAEQAGDVRRLLEDGGFFLKD